MSGIWAKAFKNEDKNPILLSTHIKDLLKCFENFKKIISDAFLKKAIETAIVCHDFGKVFPAFQIRTLKNKNYTPYYIYNNLPHSLLSLLFINQKKLYEQFSEMSCFIISAVAYHHWREQFIELVQESQDIGQLCEELKSYINRLEASLKEEIKKVGNEWEEFIHYQENIADGLKSGVPLWKYAIPPYQLYWLPEKVNLGEKIIKNWILIAGFLQRCDHFASYCEEEQIEEEPEIEGINFEQVKNKFLDTKNLNEDEVWQIKKLKNNNLNKNIILIAPTGYGKTEFAFLWSNQEKIFYTLPLRSAVNQIYNRAKKIFTQNNEEKVGLLHSDADVFLLGDGGESQRSMRSYELARQLSFPVIISTGDQFFPYALRPPGYEKIYATFSYSRLVIDEVQAYDPIAAAIIVKFISDIIRMGGKFLLMTATLPTFVKKELEKIEINDLEFINLYTEEKQKFEKINKHKLKIILLDNKINDNKPDFSLLQDKLLEIENMAKRGKRVLVITNTIKQAQNIFEELKDQIQKNNSRLEKIYLLHSQFTSKDREKIETILTNEFSNPKPKDENEGKILVATQVVEASLDIDADVLITEISPLDTLVQRMGRILRRYGPSVSLTEIPRPEEPNVYIWVYKNGLQSGRGYVYNDDLILLTLKVLKEPGISKESLSGWLNNDGKKIGDLVTEIFESKEDFEIVLSEFSKYELVDRVYEALSEKNEYLRKFMKTLSILEAGYMSDRKEEAQKMFRRINDLSIIPYKRKEEFISEVIQFFNIHKDESSHLYSYFKRDILSKFVVTVRRREKFKFDRIENWFFEQSQLDSYIEKLRRWCSDIYYSSEYDYDNNIGIKASSSHITDDIIF